MHMENRAGENARVWRVPSNVRVRLPTWKRASVDCRIVHTRVVHALITHRGLESAWVKPRIRPLIHAGVDGTEGLPWLNGRREIRMHRLLLLIFWIFRALTVGVETSSRQGFL